MNWRYAYGKFRDSRIEIIPETDNLTEDEVVLIVSFKQFKKWYDDTKAILNK